MKPSLTYNAREYKTFAQMNDAQAPTHSPDNRKVTVALFALLAGAVCIGLSPILVRLSEVGPTATAFYRVWLGLPIMGIWMLLQSPSAVVRDPRPVTLKDKLFLLIPGVFFAGDLGFWHASIGMTTIANATLLCNLAPIHVTLVSAMLFGERFNRTFLFSLLLAIGGAAILVGASTGFGGAYVKGDVLALITSMFYAGYLLTVGRMRSRHSTITIMFWSSLMAGLVLLLPTVVLSGGELPVPATLQGWTVLITLALVSHLGGQGLIALALAHLSTAFTSVALLLQPVVSALLAWWLFGEALGVYQGLGGLVVMVSIYLARMASSRR